MDISSTPFPALLKGGITDHRSRLLRLRLFLQNAHQSFLLLLSLFHNRLFYLLDLGWLWDIIRHLSQFFALLIKNSDSHRLIKDFFATGCIFYFLGKLSGALLRGRAGESYMAL